MWDGNKVASWLLHVSPSRLLLGFKVTVLLSTIVYGFLFGPTVGIFVLLLLLVAFRIPVTVVCFNQLWMGEGSNSGYPPVGDAEPPSSQTKPSQPYFLVEGGLIPSNVDSALESFLNGVLDKFVVRWQSSLEVKEELFVGELRCVMKYMLIMLLQRFQKVDWPQVITDRVFPLAVWHVDCYATGLESSQSRDIEQHVLSCFGAHIHPAVGSRRAEEDYLRSVSGKLLRQLLPDQLQTGNLLTTLLRELLCCQILQHAMDALANPDNINQFIVILLDEKETQPKSMGQGAECLVSILSHFTQTCRPNPLPKSALRPSLSSILKTPPHLYQLMQFLKRESVLKYLQFCFAVDEFNEKLLNPDLKSEQIQRLQFMGQKMFEIFFSPDSPDCIGFGTESQSQMRSIVYGKPEDIVLLRTSPTLFQAYDHVMDVLEQEVVPRFYRSPEFYRMLTETNQYDESSSSSKKKGTSVSSGWGRKLRAALRPSWLASDVKPSEPDDEGSYDTGIDLTEADYIADDVADEVEGAGSFVDLIPVCGRDLTAWRANIPRVVTAVDSAGKSIWAFEVEIQRIDLRPNDDPDAYHWCVVRTYSEFYHLESKLTEFHGEFVDFRLPPKKMFGTRTFEFLQSVRPVFESFLKSLLQQPALKASDLIFSFLTLSNLSCQAGGEGFLSGTNLLPDLGLGRMMKSVPMKLRKERGQHLESFIQTFIASTESPKPKAGKMGDSSRDPSASEVSVPVIKALHPIFQDNAKSFPLVDSIDRRTLPRIINPVALNGPYHYLLFLALKVWKLPRILWTVLAGLGSLVSVYFDAFVRRYVRDKLCLALQPSRIAHVINLLNEIVLDGVPPKIGLEVEHRRAAWKSITGAIPARLKNVFGVIPIEDRCQLVFQCLQFPIFNKQLSYALFDILFMETFPEVYAADLVAEPSS